MGSSIPQMRVVIILNPMDAGVRFQNSQWSSKSRTVDWFFAVDLNFCMEEI